MVRVLGTHGVKGPIIVFYFSVFSCLSVIPWMVFHFTPMTVKQFAILMMAGLFAAGGQFTITAASFGTFIYNMKTASKKVTAKKSPD